MNVRIQKKRKHKDRKKMETEENLQYNEKSLRYEEFRTRLRLNQNTLLMTFL